MFNKMTKMKSIVSFLSLTKYVKLYRICRFTANCERETLDISGYYCNKELVQLLVFDAKVTNDSYGTWKFENRRAERLIGSYNATLRFVATMSGLTRWQFIYGEEEIEGDK